jgi:membrane-associated phospholipid phosphatase
LSVKSRLLGQTSLHLNATSQSLKSTSWAQVVSHLLSPPVVWGVLVVLIAFRDAQSDQQALTVAAAYGVFVCLLPGLYIVWMLRRGAISDIHLSARKERPRVLLVSAMGAGLAWGALRWLEAPPGMPLIAVITLALLLVIALISLVWQISMHATSISAAVVATGAFFGIVPALLILPLALLVAAARLYLKKHTPAEILAGTLVGGLIPVLLVATGLVSG